MIETYSSLPQKSSAIFENLRKFRKMFDNVRVTFRQVLENLRKIVKNAIISVSI